MIFSKTELNFVERQAFTSFKHGFFQVWGKCLPQSFPTPNGVTGISQGYPTLWHHLVLEMIEVNIFSDLEEAMFETGESLFSTKLSSVFEKIIQLTLLKVIWSDISITMLYNILLPINHYIGNSTTKHHSRSMSDNRDLTKHFIRKFLHIIRLLHQPSRYFQSSWICS